MSELPLPSYSLKSVNIDITGSLIYFVNKYFQVNIAEEAVRRVTGTTLLLSTTPDMAASSMPFSTCVSDAASAACPVEKSMKLVLQAPLEVQDDQIKLDLPNATITLTSWEMGTMPASLRCVASLENLQKRIHGDSVYSESASTFSDLKAVANDKWHVA
uniref:Basic leucine-zipper C-terminal domain-containing protein n=1 Tax=Arundo donax TaxID=35708 RepID=A0A0A9CUR4_ARUDO